MPERILHFYDFADASAPGIVVCEAEHGATDMHEHEFYEFVYIRSGFCLHEMVNKTELLVEGDCFLIAPGIRHRYLGPYSVGLYNCLFKAEAMEKLTGELPPLSLAETEPVKLHLDLNEQKSLQRLFRGMLEDSKTRDIGWQLRVRCQFMCAMVDYARALARRVSMDGERDVYPNYVVHALSLIEERYADSDLSVAGIAQESGVSPDYLSRQFKMLTGLSVLEYLRRYRFARATALLRNGTSVGETAKAVGFASICHFSREFKKEMGVQPTRYARHINEE